MSRADHTASNSDARKRLAEHRREQAAAAPEPSCAFPDCRFDARPDEATCELHANVRVTGSWVESAKHEDDGGS